MSTAPQGTPTALLVQEYRELLMCLDVSNAGQVRRADALEEEILRRMAW